MLARSRRLTSQKDFERVFKKGKKIREGFLILAASKNDLGQARFGFIVSQKVSKKATLRNKIKRRLRSLAKLKLGQIKEGLDIVVVAIPGLEAKSFLETEEAINKLFKKIKC